MTKLEQAEKENTRATALAKALATILKNRGRSVDSIASWDILDALDNLGLKLVSSKRITMAEFDARLESLTDIVSWENG